MDAVVLPLLSTTNLLDPEVLPPVRVGVFWEARWQPLREERVLLISHRGCRPCFVPTGEVSEPGVPGRGASGARVVCETSEFMVCVPFFARHADKVFIIPRGPAASCAELNPAQQEPLVATMVESPIRYRNDKRGRPGRESGTA